MESHLTHEEPFVADCKCLRQVEEVMTNIKVHPEIRSKLPCIVMVPKLILNTRQIERVQWNAIVYEDDVLRKFTETVPELVIVNSLFDVNLRRCELIIYITLQRWDQRVWWVGDLVKLNLDITVNVYI